MTRAEYRALRAAHRRRRYEAQQAQFADSPGWALTELARRPKLPPLPQPRRSSMGQLLEFQRQRRSAFLLLMAGAAQRKVKIRQFLDMPQRTPLERTLRDIALTWGCGLERAA